MTTPPDSEGIRWITLAEAEEAIQKRVLRYDREDEHYDVISAFIKSMRAPIPRPLFTGWPECSMPEKIPLSFVAGL